MVSGSADLLQFDAGRMAASLLAIQLLPLFAGFALRHFRPSLAERLSVPATFTSKVLNAFMITAVVLAQYKVFGEIGMPVAALIALLALVFLAAGHLTGGPDSGNRRTLAILTALRNMSLGMVIATTAFAGTPVITVVLVCAVISGTLLLLFALWSGSRR
jgi:BASS family bile acid:Na+ symporter